METIARIQTGFPQKFGIPRQSGLADIPACIVFEPAYAHPDAVRGLEGFSHLWLIWLFQDVGEGWSPTVRPPVLGGNKRMGVFATRSPFRPNHLGLSSVALERVELTEAGPVLHVRGADLRDGTPIVDIKPYLPYTDCHPEATGGFTDAVVWKKLQVEFAPDALAQTSPLSDDELRAIRQILEQDPRPARQRSLDKEFAITYNAHGIRFRVSGEVLTVERIEDAGC